MDILGIGPLELAFIIIIILLVLGPKEMVNALRTLGRVMRGIVTSDWWQTTRQAIQDVRKLPYDLMRDAGMEEDLRALDEIRRTASGTSTAKPGSRKSTRDEALAAWTTPAADPSAVEADSESEPRILPPSQEPVIAPPRHDQAQENQLSDQETESKPAADQDQD
jgi:Sec-independent protein translocase protein TatA